MGNRKHITARHFTDDDESYLRLMFAGTLSDTEDPIDPNARVDLMSGSTTGAEIQKWRKRTYDPDREGTM